MHAPYHQKNFVFDLLWLLFFWSFVCVCQTVEIQNGVNSENRDKHKQTKRTKEQNKTNRMASETSLKHLPDKDDAHREDEARGNAGCSLEEASDDKRDPAETEWSDKTLQAKSFWKRRRERVKANLQETVKNLSEEQFREDR